MLPSCNGVTHSQSSANQNVNSSWRTAIPAILTVVLVLISCSNTFANYQVGTLFTRPGWDYAASMIDEGTVQKFWWCGSGYTSGYSGLTDVIYYRSYNVSTQQWSATYQVISPVVGSWEFNGGAGTCNPTVVKGTFSPGGGVTFTYALYYTAQNDNMNKIGVAFSNDGITFIKYAGNPIIYPIVFPVPSGRYGAGSSSSWQDAYYGSSAVYLFEYDDSTSLLERGWWRYASDGIHFSAATVISNSANFGTTVRPMTDLAYDIASATFYGVSLAKSRPGDREGWQFGFYKMPSSQLFSGGAGTWNVLGLVDTNLTGSYLNLQGKLRRDGYGQTTSFFPNLEAYFSRGTNDPTTWDLSYVIQNAQPSTYPLIRYYNPQVKPLGDHWVTTGSVTYGYSLEFTLGYLYMAPQPNTIPLYSCLAIYDHFVSPASNCEGQTVLGMNGWIYSSPPVGVPNIAMYRCIINIPPNTDHFVSVDPNCEGWTREFLLGYGKTQP